MRRASAALGARSRSRNLRPRCRDCPATPRRRRRPDALSWRGHDYGRGACMSVRCEEPVDDAALESMRALLWDYIREMRTIYDGTRMVAELDDATWTRELAVLAGKYGAPTGALLLACDGDTAAGCVAMRRLDDTTGEMKRLYVAPAFRGRGLSRLLVQRLARLALERG